MSSLMSREEALRIKLDRLKIEHRDLDAAITAMGESSPENQLTVKRLKKRKLMLKDEIIRLEDKIYPDIIA
jgi:hypothetical protein